MFNIIPYLFHIISVGESEGFHLLISGWHLYPFLTLCARQQCAQLCGLWLHIVTDNSSNLFAFGEAVESQNLTTSISSAMPNVFFPVYHCRHSDKPIPGPIYNDTTIQVVWYNSPYSPGLPCWWMVAPGLGILVHSSPSSFDQLIIISVRIIIMNH